MIRLRIDDISLERIWGRYIRAEIYQGQTPVLPNVRTLREPVVFIRGKLVWDGDAHGHLEIHPERANDYRIVSSRANN